MYSAGHSGVVSISHYISSNPVEGRTHLPQICRFHIVVLKGKKGPFYQTATGTRIIQSFSKDTPSSIYITIVTRNHFSVQCLQHPAKPLAFDKYQMCFYVKIKQNIEKEIDKTVTHYSFTSLYQLMNFDHGYLSLVIIVKILMDKALL